MNNLQYLYRSIARVARISPEAAGVLDDYLLTRMAEKADWYEKGIPTDAQSMTPPKPTGTEAAVCADIARRQQLGILKYGVTVADNPLELRAWLQHAYEECLDQAVYLRRAIAEIDAA